MMSQGLHNHEDWVTDESVEDFDPEGLFEIPGTAILVRPVLTRSKQTVGGIFIPDKIRDDALYLSNVGRVLAVGDLAYHPEEAFPKGPWVKRGDYVLYRRHVGHRAKMKGICVILLPDREALVKLNDPTVVDTLANSL
jgi:co-chaperonin GroES (HSP10)